MNQLISERQSGVLAPGSSTGALNCADLLFSGGAFAVKIAGALSCSPVCRSSSRAAARPV